MLDLSPFNNEPEAIAGFRPPKEVLIHDCTLRDGEQQPGLVFREDEKVAIAQRLDELGIQQIEAGMPAVSEEDRSAIRRIVGLRLNAKISALCRLVKEDIDMALDCDVWGIVCSAPAGYLQLKHKLKWSEEQFTRTVLEITDYVKSHGLYVILSPYDTTRADLRFLTSLVQTCVREGKIDRVRVVDTVGCAAPHAMTYIVRKIKDAAALPVEVHCHDDFGLATANTIAGVLGGAEVVSTTINGVGERSGNTPTEEVAVSLKLLYGIETGLRYDKLYEVSAFIQRVSKVPLQSHKAIVGENSFKQESGLIVGGFLEMPATAQPFDPKFVGRDWEIVLGKKSGRRSIEYKLERMGIEATDEQVELLLQKVKEQSISKKGALTDEEFGRLVRVMSMRASS